MKTRWVSFDCFGTLVDWHAGFTTLLTPILGDRVLPVLRAYHRWERELEAERPHRLYRDVLVTGLQRAARESGVELSAAEAHRLPESWGALPLFPDVEDMLASLRALGARIAVLTNCDDDLFAATQKSFRRPFDLVITAEQVRDYKPSLTHFRRFATDSGVAPADWVHVASSQYHDILPARSLGIHRLWLDRDRTGEDPAMASARVLSGGEVSRRVFTKGRKPFR